MEPPCTQLCSTVYCTVYIHENSQTIFVALSLKVVLKWSTWVAQVSGKKSSVMYCTVGKPTQFIKFPVEGGMGGGGRGNGLKQVLTKVSWQISDHNFSALLPCHFLTFCTSTSTQDHSLLIYLGSTSLHSSFQFKYKSENSTICEQNSVYRGWNRKGIQRV